MIWARMLAYITGTVDQELLLRNEYLAAESPSCAKWAAPSEVPLSRLLGPQPLAQIGASTSQGRAERVCPPLSPI
jgi:hypothetical protein